MEETKLSIFDRGEGLSRYTKKLKKVIIAIPERLDDSEAPSSWPRVARE